MFGNMDLRSESELHNHCSEISSTNFGNRKSKSVESKEYCELFLSNNIDSIYNNISETWSLISLLIDGSFLDSQESTETMSFHYQNIVKPEWTLEELIEYTDNDQRIRKSRILIEWLEDCYKKKVVNIQKISNSTWPTTLRKIIYSNEFSEKSPDSANSIHPDAQLQGRDACFLNLDGNDNGDQELLLKFIYQLIRSGQIVEAQQIALDNNIYWLASSLQGVANVFYKQDFEMDENMTTYVSRRGNIFRSMWLKTCWNYSEKLSTNKINWLAINNVNADSSNSTSISSLIEMSIYASFSNNVNVMLKSPLISSTYDKLWVVMKAAHECSLDEIVYFHSESRSKQSKLYPGCDKKYLNLCHDMIEKVKATVGSFNFPTSNYDILFSNVLPANLIDGLEWDFDFLILQLQLSFMKGRQGIKNYLETTLTTVVTSQNKAFPHKEDILLLYCLLTIWIYKLNDNTDIKHPLNSILSDRILHLSIEAYVHVLIESNYHLLCLPYLKYLCSLRRLVQFMKSVLNLDDKICNGCSNTKQSEIMIPSMICEDREISNILISLVHIHFKSHFSVDIIDSIDVLNCQSSLSLLPIHDNFDPFPWFLCLDSAVFFTVEHIIRFINYNICHTNSVDSIELDISELLIRNDTAVSVLTDLSLNASTENPQIIFPMHLSYIFTIQSQDTKFVHDATLDSIYFMKHYCVTMDSYKLWFSKFNNFKNSLFDLRNNLTNSIESESRDIDNYAVIAISHLYNILHSEDLNYISDGITELWQNLEIDSLIQLRLSILSLEKSVDVAKVSITEDKKSLSPKSSKLFDKFQNLFNDIFSNGDHFTTYERTDLFPNDMYSIFIKLKKEIPNVISNLQESSSNVSDLLYEIEFNLSKCILYLDDYENVIKASSLFITSIIEKYIHIAIEMTNLFTLLKNSKRSDYWKSRTVNMLTILANEKSSLRLYEVISQSDLNTYMKKITEVLSDSLL